MSYARLQYYLSKGTFLTCKVTNSCFPKILFRSKHQEKKLILKMNEAFVRYDEGTDNFDVTFRYVNAEYNVNKQFNFNRKSDSTVSNFLSRVDANVSKVLSAKKKKKKRKSKGEVLEDDLPVAECKSALLSHGLPIEGDAPCRSVFTPNADVSLVLLGSVYSVKYNAPWVSNIALPKCILASFPTYPSKFETYHTSQVESAFTWYRNNKSKPNANDWQEAAQGFVYTPKVEEIGCLLKLQCVPKKADQIGPTVEVTSPSTIEAGPGYCPFETRHLFTRTKLSGNCFRIVSYNILADLYTDSSYSREELFPYCPPYALDIDYRKYLILKELIGYNSDIICLQEVDSKIFQHDLLPTLSTLDYNGVFNRKGGTVSEGLSTFFNIHRFQKLNFESAVLSQNVDLPGFDQTWKSITNEKFKERFLCRSTAVQATTLLSLDNLSEILVVGNTHLYFHPDADHIRLLQGYYALHYVRNVANEVQKKFPDHNVSIVLCGDFNSVPECGIYQLMCKKQVPEDCKDWNSNPEEAVHSVSLSHDMSFASACGTPEYTNFTKGFADCLDYIYYQTDRLQVEQVIPMPSTEELTEYTALPSVVFPSDHISICADLKWNITR
ncbi:2',5'-phosphodiesterase 12 [Neodiprion lecontei]|uniref:2',5'-phosphodiesterase 12 n=1 Tax=Neodiprion lecontei TaxID=441921 RepID=A0A6J0B9U8_NEOLC|nr:2',5'-phosphodiesterase 12 [Neodiprion lecontei]